MKTAGFIFCFIFSTLLLQGQPADCVFKSPQFTIHFGSGNVPDVTTDYLAGYRRVSSYCPTDGHYSYAPYTRACFSNDWHTLIEDHTPGDANGNMMLVNAAPFEGVFLKTPVAGLKNNTTYELALWLLNLCKPTRKCPFPLLPRLSIRLEAPDGKVVANIITGDVSRFQTPLWTQHSAFFTTPASTTTLMLVMANNAPGGCGNDFAMDDITFRECVKKSPPVVQLKISPAKKTSSQPKQSVNTKPQTKATPPRPKEAKVTPLSKTKNDSEATAISAVKQNPNIFPPPPMVLKTRENALAKKIEMEAGEIKIQLFDNGEIDGDTVSIYHNNVLIRSHMRLSQKPISFTISLSASQPHHELVMVAENLGSIPPNTSMMIISSGSKRFEVFISSTEQKNAKVIFDLKN